MGGVIDFLVHPARRSGETPEERRRKRLFIPVAWCVLIFQIMTFCLEMWAGGDLVAAVLGQSSFVAAIAGIAVPYTTKRLPQLFLESEVFGIGMVSLIISEMTLKGIYGSWLCGVILINLLIYVKADSRAAIWMTFCVCVLVVLTTVEEGYSFGFHDTLPSNMESRNCEHISSSTTISLVLFRVALVMVSVTITRSFANTLHAKQDELQSAIVTAERVAEALVAFDLEEAERALPPETVRTGDHLGTAFSTLIQHLRCYRPFLPDALFHTGVPPLGGCGLPGAQSEEVAIVFTDIQSSTSLWECCPQAMREAMVLHNRIIRDAVAACDGYEVKTAGDAFMVAFPSALLACKFALRTQEALVSSVDWPHALLQQPLCALTPDGLWNGLRVRIGIHVGTPDFQRNPVTGRGDYFGPDVNKASRVEELANGGVIAVTQEVMDRLTPDDLAVELEGPTVVSDGLVALRGVGAPAAVYRMVNRRLRERLSVPSPRRPPKPRCFDSPVFSRPGVETVVVTAGTVRVQYTMAMLTGKDDQANGLLCVILDTVERCHGLVRSVHGSSIALSWNAGRACPSHVHESSRFAGLLHSKVRHTLWETSVWVGLSSGGAVAGSLGSDTHRFISLIGQCVEIADAASLAANGLGAFAVVGIGRKCDTIDCALRRVGEWTLASGTTVELYQLNTLSMEDRDSHFALAPWPEASRAALEESSLTGNTAPLLALPPDPVLSVVASLIEAQAKVPTPLIPSVEPTSDAPPPVTFNWCRSFDVPTPSLSPSSLHS